MCPLPHRDRPGARAISLPGAVPDGRDRSLRQVRPPRLPRTVGPRRSLLDRGDHHRRSGSRPRPVGSRSAAPATAGPFCRRRLRVDVARHVRDRAADARRDPRPRVRSRPRWCSAARRRCSSSTTGAGCSPRMPPTLEPAAAGRVRPLRRWRCPAAAPLRALTAGGRPAGHARHPDRATRSTRRAPPAAGGAPDRGGLRSRGPARRAARARRRSTSRSRRSRGTSSAGSGRASSSRRRSSRCAARSAPTARRRSSGCSARGVRVFHLYADLEGRDTAGRPLPDSLRAVHAHIVQRRWRDSLSFVVSGGIAAAEHLPKVIACGADVVVLDLVPQVAWGCALWADKAPAPSRPREIDAEWGAQRLRQPDRRLARPAARGARARWACARCGGCAARPGA